MRNRYVVFFVLLICLLFSGCSKWIDKGKSITIVGSSAMQPLIESAGEEYSSQHLGEFVNVQGGGSGTGLSQVQSGAVDIGNSDLYAEEKSGIQAEELVDHRVAVVGITPIINQNAGLKDISLEDLRKVFTGQVTNWEEIGGKSQPIVLINRASGSGTRHTFEKWVLHGEEAKQAQEQDSSGMVRQIVSDTPGAISYVAFSYVTKDVQTLTINGIAPTEENVKKNKWSIWSYEHMYTKGEPEGLTKDFIEYVLSDTVQKNLVPKLGYIAVSDMEVERDLTGNITQKKK